MTCHSSSMIPAPHIHLERQGRDTRGEYLVVFTVPAGPCGYCRLEASTFITRNGNSRCLSCELKEEIAWRSSQPPSRL